MQHYKVLIADDHGAFRRTVHSFLDRLPNVSVVGEAVDGLDVIQKVEDLQPNIVLMDIGMPFQSGIAATRIIKERWPSIRVIIVSMHEGSFYRAQADKAKADGYIQKSSLKSKLEEVFIGMPTP